MPAKSAKKPAAKNLPSKKPAAKKIAAKKIAAKAPAAKPKASPKPKPAPALRHLVALTGSNPKARSDAEAALRKQGPSAVAELRASLGQGPLTQRAALAMSLVRVDVDALAAALPTLTELIGSSNKAQMAELLQLATALGSRAEPLVPALLDRLEHASEPQAKAIVAAVRAAGALGARLVDDAATRATGAQAARLVALLDGFDRPEHTARLAALVHHPEPGARLAAVRALGRRRGRESLPPLLRALQDPEVEVTRAAQLELRKIPATMSEPVIASFLQRLRQDPAAARNRVVVVLSELGVASFEDIGPLLLDALGDDDPAHRAGAARGLLELAPTAHAALPRLRNQRKDRVEAVRAAVEAAIAAIEQKGTK